MPEHVHDWWPMPIKHGGDAEFYGAECLIEGCDAILMETEVAKRLTEYETLKRATERLSAEDARFAVKRIEDHIGYEWDDDEGTMFALDAYADILEGK